MIYSLENKHEGVALTVAVASSIFRGGTYSFIPPPLNEEVMRMQFISWQDFLQIVEIIILAISCFKNKKN